MGTQSRDGARFALVAVIGPRFPMTLMPGLTFNGRAVVLGMAGLFGGGVAAALAAVVAAADPSCAQQQPGPTA